MRRFHRRSVAQRLEEQSGNEGEIVDQALAEDIVQMGPDPELVELAELAGRMPKSFNHQRFTGSFRGELAAYLWEQRLGVRATFPAGVFGATAPEETVRDLCRVDVPPHLATSWVLTLSDPSHAGVGVAGPYDNPSADILRMFARIKIGTAGAQSLVEVDWRQGSRFEVTGSSISVQAVLPAEQIAPPGPFGYPLSLSASIAPGTIAQPIPVTRTILYDTMVAEASDERIIPRFGRRVYFLKQSPSKDDAWRAIFLSNNFATVEQVVEFRVVNSRLDGDLPEPIIVPPRATGLRITNTGVSNTLSKFLAIYELAI